MYRSSGASDSFKTSSVTLSTLQVAPKSANGFKTLKLASNADVLEPSVVCGDIHFADGLKTSSVTLSILQVSLFGHLRILEPPGEMIG